MMPLGDILTMSTENLVYVVFLPFLLILVLLFAALEVLHLFQRKINLILSFIFTFLAMQTEQYWWFANLLPTYGSFVAIGSFVVVFFVGVVLWARGRIENIYLETGGARKKHDRLIKKQNELRRKMENEMDEVKKRKIYDEIERIEKDKKYLETIMEKES